MVKFDLMSKLARINLMLLIWFVIVLSYYTVNLIVNRYTILVAGYQNQEIIYWNSSLNNYFRDLSPSYDFIVFVQNFLFIIKRVSTDCFHQGSSYPNYIQFALTKVLFNC